MISRLILDALCFASSGYYIYMYIYICILSQYTYSAGFLLKESLNLFIGSARSRLKKHGLGYLGASADTMKKFKVYPLAK